MGKLLHGGPSVSIHHTNHNIMNHPFLHPVDPGNNTVPVCYDRLQSWIDRLPGWFSNDVIPAPKATMLCGLPGSGKSRTVKAIARTLGRLLHRLDPACGLAALAEIHTLLGADKQPGVLWIDQPSAVQIGIHRNGLIECAHQILALRQVHPGFTAHGTIDQRQQ